MDVSGQYAADGIVERGISVVWHKILSEGCQPQAGGSRRPGLVLDVVRACCCCGWWCP